jgi:putative sigma-54 modulation protein
MQINISGHHVEVTQALKDYVHTKVEKLERHFDNITNVQVTLTVENHTQKAEATMHAAGVELHAHSDVDDDNMYAAIDGLADKLDRQLLKHKEKTTSHRNGSTH